MYKQNIHDMFLFIRLLLIQMSWFYGTYNDIMLNMWSEKKKKKRMIKNLFEMKLKVELKQSIEK